MNPHRHLWMFNDYPFLKLITVVILVGWFFSRKAGVPVSLLTACLAGWLLYTAFTSALAFYPADAWPKWQQLGKTIVACFVMLTLFQDEKKLKQLLAVIMLCIGFYGIKGSLFFIATGRSGKIFGPDDTFIEDNNALAGAELMVLPFFLLFARHEKRRWLRRLLLASTGLILIAVILSYSRGALLALVATALFLVWTEKGRMKPALLIAALVIGGIPFIPKDWFERMSTVKSYQQDVSARGRINAWAFSYNLASENLFGGGFEVYRPETFSKYAPVKEDYHSAHSIYFGVLGEHGFLGLALFLSIILETLRVLQAVKRAVEGYDAYRWFYDVGTALQCSMISYGVAGAFLDLAYFDLFYYLVTCAILLDKMAGSRIAIETELPMGRKSNT